MKQLTHVPLSISRASIDAIRSRRPPAPKLPSVAEDGAFWPCAPAATVRIYQMEREWDSPFWLCPAAVEIMKADRWTVRSHRAPPFDSLQCYIHRGRCPDVKPKGDQHGDSERK